MAIQRSGRIRVVAEARTPQLLPSGVLGMLIFVFTELMLFVFCCNTQPVEGEGQETWTEPLTVAMDSLGASGVSTTATIQGLLVTEKLPPDAVAPPPVVPMVELTE